MVTRCRLFHPPPDPELVFRHDWRVVGTRSDASARFPPRAPTTPPFGDLVDFSDPESQRVLSAAAGALIGELARQAARECFAESLANRTEP